MLVAEAACKDEQNKKNHRQEPECEETHRVGQETPQRETEEIEPWDRVPRRGVAYEEPNDEK